MNLTISQIPDHDCPRPATVAMEGYSPRNGLAHGSLDLVVTACDQHADTARAWILETTDLRPHQAIQGDPGHHISCGKVSDYRDDQPTAPLYRYIVDRCAEDTAMSGGTRPLPTGWDTRALAEELCREIRVLHSYTAGPIRCSLWPETDPDEPHPIAMHNPAPTTAEQFTYGERTR